MISGLVIKAQSGFFTVETTQGHIVCKIPKRLTYKTSKKQHTQDELVSDIVAIGDRVTLTLNEDGNGTIESVEPRQSVLSRVRPSAHSRRQLLQDREQVLLANPDQVIFVFSIKNPEPSLRKLDRLLIIAERNQLPAVICVNKIDLASLQEAQATFAIYEKIGYNVLYVSALTDDGIDQLRDRLRDKISVFAGSSGVGKSSLLNAIQPNLGLMVSQVSEATTKGRHTTRYSELFALDFGGYVADTPGIRGVALFDLEPSELDGYFREIAPLVVACAFRDCSHQHERGCAVREAVEDGLVSAERYDSYLRLREEHEQLARAKWY